ncbi:MAG: flagellar biosynthetic protein FliQ [Betaproteobacteria bacterium]|nr:flagellar biosynthetic protein FliQ [Betaproteobacteria bacterium]
MFTSQSVLTLVQKGMMVTMMVSAPMLIAALLTGLLVSIFQAATQINESTLSFIPKLAAIFAVMLVAGPWMLATLTDYMRELITQIPQIIG